MLRVRLTPSLSGYDTVIRLVCAYPMFQSGRDCEMSHRELLSKDQIFYEPHLHIIF